MAERLGRAETVHGIPPMFLHGDVQINNILFSKDGSKLRALIDWQIIHKGSVVEDICRIMFSMPTDVRREHLHTLLKRYHTRLTSQIPNHFSLSGLSAAVGEYWPLQVSFFAQSAPGFLKLPVFRENSVAEKFIRNIRDMINDLPSL